MTTQNMSTDHSRAVLDGAHSHGGGTKPLGSRADRATSFNIADFPVPNGREEDWRFTPLARIEALFAEELTGTGPQVQVSAPESVQVSEVSADRAEELKLVGAPEDRTAVTSWANFKAATVVELPAQTELDEPVLVRLEGADYEASAGHLVIKAGERAKGVVVVSHTGKAKFNQTVQVVAGTDSELTVVATHEWDGQSTHAANHRIAAATGAQVKHIIVTLGGDLVRVCTDARMSEPGANVELLGLYFTDSKQHHEHRLFVAHENRNCISRVTYKGALQGEDAHAVWVGDVLIGAEAFGTDTYELNRNLVLTEGARADSVPNLEIENGEIEGAGHASATGRFDDEQLFYLTSRGIPAEIARKLVVRGFFAELINQIGVPAVSEHLMELIEAELAETEAIAEEQAK
ncbi:Fe-S cluster assembly protein SufD [Boudabousia liubingyangii]|uniref:Fe-S cluster assembly protein SufD n=1 Tax=Boudabousia liubingyangii TaxID=1921764 RepID=A0A1Q5PNA5_9ACTO|nr:Fe-S cluster assembly protein SufD [Boudabousia liubingyangii]OKL47582.1 Fe-S cluster assembly protein SufD [Boudabousia liubingyangii]OKL49006.1 Fe-S cluster assembly protein SufD [Boudabousia liubingyangii]